MGIPIGIGSGHVVRGARYEMRGTDRRRIDYEDK